MATPEQIRHRVEEADTARSARRAAAAQQIGELAQHRTAIAEQLDDIERQLGDVLADAGDVIDIDELARFTDLPAADLTRWLTSRKTTRSKRKKSTVAVSGIHNDVSTRSAARTPIASRAAAMPESTANMPAQVM